MSLHFTTESRSHYEIDGDRVRRVPEARPTGENALRGDREWVKVLELFALELGQSAIMQLQLPAVYGPTLRTTSPVERIWYDDKETAA